MLHTSWLRTKGAPSLASSRTGVSMNCLSQARIVLIICHICHTDAEKNHLMAPQHRHIPVCVCEAISLTEQLPSLLCSRRPVVSAADAPGNTFRRVSKPKCNEAGRILPPKPCVVRHEALLQALTPPVLVARHACQHCLYCRIERFDRRGRVGARGKGNLQGFVFPLICFVFFLHITRYS